MSKLFKNKIYVTFILAVSLFGCSTAFTQAVAESDQAHQAKEPDLSSQNEAKSTDIQVTIHFFLMRAMITLRMSTWLS